MKASDKRDASQRDADGRLRVVQEARLRELAVREGDFFPLLYFYAACRDYAALEGLKEEGGERSEMDRLVCNLFCGGEATFSVQGVLEEGRAAATSWVMYTLAKYALQRGHVREALLCADVVLERGLRDTTILNLTGFYLLQREEWALAEGVLRQSLVLAPEQRDVVNGIAAAQAQRWTGHPVYLDVWPRVCAVGVYVPVATEFVQARACLDALLNQCYPLGALYLVGKEGADEVQSLCAAYPISCIAPDAGGCMASFRNRVFERAQVEVVAGFDPWVCVEPEYLLYAMMEFELGGASLAGVGGRLFERNMAQPPDRWRAIHLTQDNGEERQFMDTAPPPDLALSADEEQFYRNRPFLLYDSNSVLRRASVLAVGGYDEVGETNAEDVTLCERFRRHGQHYVYAPSARAWHERLDDLYSVLRTDWDWDFGVLKEYGFYRNVSSFLQMLHYRIHETRSRIAADFYVGLGNEAFITFAALLHHASLDVRYMEQRNTMRQAVGEALLGLLLERLQRRSEILYEHIIGALGEVLVASFDGLEELSPGEAAYATVIWREYEDFLAMFTEEQLQLLEGYPNNVEMALR